MQKITWLNISCRNIGYPVIAYQYLHITLGCCV